MAAWRNPNAGKILGYVYDNRETPAWLQALEQGTSDEGTPYRYSRLDNISVRQYDPASKKIPLYASPFIPMNGNRPMSEEEQFAIAAQLAGARDMSVFNNDLGPGHLESRYINSDVRQAFGFPTSIDKIEGVDPTKADWGAGGWQLSYPTSGSFFQHLMGFVSDMPLPLKIFAAMATGGATLAEQGVAEAGAELTASQIAQAADIADLAQAADFADIASAFDAADVASALGSTASSLGVAQLTADPASTAALFDLAAPDVAKITQVPSVADIKQAADIADLTQAADAADVAAAMDSYDVAKALGDAPVSSTSALLTDTPKPVDYATPTEAFIDKGGLGGAPASSTSSLLSNLSTISQAASTAGLLGGAVTPGVSATPFTTTAATPIPAPNLATNNGNAPVNDLSQRLMRGRSSTILTGGRGENESLLNTSAILLGA